MDLSRRKGGWPARVLSAALLAVTHQSGATGNAAELNLVTVEETTLSKQFGLANDVRWDDPSHVLFTLSGVGLVRAAYQSGELSSPQTLVPQGGFPGIAIAAHLANSLDAFAVAAPFSEMFWRVRGAGGGEGRLGTWWADEKGSGISFFEDIDIWGRELAVLGLMRSDQGMSPDGAVAWRVALGTGKVELSPVLYSFSGKGARPYDACAIFGIGNLRYFPDGRLVIAPGAEPGVLVFDPKGKVVKSWDTSPLGVDVKCDFSEQSMRAFRSSEKERLSYLRSYSFIDEILPVNDGVLAIVKAASASKKASSWTAYLLREDKETLRVQLPWTSSSLDARLSADVQGDRLLFLVSEIVPDQPPTGGRLIVAKLAETARLPVKSH